MTIQLLVVRERMASNSSTRFYDFGNKGSIRVSNAEIFLRKLLSAVHNLPQTSCWRLKQKGLGTQLWQFARSQY